jgi:hypothetical protein
VTRRRGLLKALIAAPVALAAPAIIRTPGLLMPVRKPHLSDWLQNPARLTFSAELTAITRAAFVPRLEADLYRSSPLMGLFRA